MKRPKMKREFFKDRAKKWRWRIRALNGRITACAGENFDSRRNAVRAFNSFFASIGFKWQEL